MHLVSIHFFFCFFYHQQLFNCDGLLILPARSSFIFSYACLTGNEVVTRRGKVVLVIGPSNGLFFFSGLISIHHA